MLNIQKYIVTEQKAIIPVDVTLVLTDKQAAARKRYLKSTGKGKYLTTHQVEFKQDEEIGIIGGIKSKELIGQLEKVVECVKPRAV